MHNLLIIGNGFDLAHDLSTSYRHFIEYMVKEIVNDSQKYKDIVEINPAVINSVEAFNDFFKKTDYMSFKNIFFKTLYNNHCTTDWSDIESLYYNELLTIGKKDSPYQSPKKLNDEFKQIKECLESYLSLDINKNPKRIDAFNYLFNKVNSKNTLIINFNYTNTIRDYLDGLSSKLIHIHGNLNSKTNPIVFGYAAFDSEARMLIEKNENEYLRNIKKNCYKMANNENFIRDYLDGTKQIDVSIIGHSCGISDKLILQEIFNHENIRSIRILYHKEYESFFQKQVNIDRIMNNDSLFKKLKPFDRKFKFPSTSSEKEDIENLKYYIDILVTEQEDNRNNAKNKVFST